MKANGLVKTNKIVILVDWVYKPILQCNAGFWYVTCIILSIQGYAFFVNINIWTLPSALSFEIPSMPSSLIQCRRESLRNASIVVFREYRTYARSLSSWPVTLKDIVGLLVGVPSSSIMCFLEERERTYLRLQDNLVFKPVPSGT